MAGPPPPGQQATIEHQREPCPDRILDDIGGAFAMGAVGGGVWHFIKGMKNSPSGYRVKGAFETIRRESPRLGGSFANWGLTFSLFDCSLQAIRHKEDPWNAIGAGALTGGFLQLRFGLKSAAKSAMFGGFLLAMIEGLSLTMSKLLSPPPPGVMATGPGGPMGPGGPISGGPGMGPALPPLGMEGLPAGPAASSSTAGDGAEGGGVGGFFGSLFGSSPAAPPPQPVVDLTDDPFKAPPLPAEFATSDSFKS